MSSKSSKYHGVYYNKAQAKYHSNIKTRFLGAYLLETDAAWAHDEGSRKLGLSPTNFRSRLEYNNARKQEANERQINLPCSKVQEYMTSKVNAVVEQNGVDKNDDASPGNEKNDTGGKALEANQ
jgi:hypothetical protein